MLEQPQKVLRLACLIFGVILVCQFALLIKRGDPLNRLTIPQVPTLASASETNSPATKGSEKKGTNAAASKDLEKKGTNAPGSTESGKAGTNAAAAKESGKGSTNANTEIVKRNGSTNQTASKNETNTAPPSTATNTEKVASIEQPEKAGAKAAKSKTKTEGTTNSISATNMANAGTNLMAAGTNSVSKAGTNAASGKEMAKKGGPRPRGEPGKVPDDLPPLIKGRIERITMSEILGQIVRPMPMALLGIADKDVFLRAPDGQTGMLKVGGELGGVKLLQVGTNRILIEHEGQKKELTLFSGLGSETLMPKTTDKTNETTKKTP